MKRNFMTRIALGAMAILASTAAYADPYRIAVSNSYIGNEWRVEMINFMQAYAAKNLKGKVELTVNNSGTDAQKQIAVITDMISDGVNAILVNPASDTALDAVLAEVRSGKAAPAREAVRTPKGPELPVGAITIAAKEMVVLGRRLTGATLRAVPTSAQSVDDWQVAVGATELAGDIRWQGAGRGNVTARFKHLTIPDRAVKVGAQGQAKADDPLADLPSLDVIAESFTLNAKQYGQLRLVAANEDRAWRIRFQRRIKYAYLQNREGRKRGGAF